MPPKAKVGDNMCTNVGTNVATNIYGSTYIIRVRSAFSETSGFWRSDEDGPLALVMGVFNLQQTAPGVVCFHFLDAIVKKGQPRVHVRHEASLLNKPNEHLCTRHVVVEFVICFVSCLQKTC